MKYISMLNPYSFKWLWSFKEGKTYLNNIINKLLNNKETYELLDFFNDKFNSVKSYCIFESNKSVVLIDFNLILNSNNNSSIILDYLETVCNKRLYLIIFNNYKGKDIYLNHIYNSFKENNEITCFLYANSHYLQEKCNPTLTKRLYQMDNETYKLYNHENELMNRN